MISHRKIVKVARMVSFLKTGISNNLNGSDNDYLLSECEEEEC